MMNEVVERVALAIFSQGHATEWCPGISEEVREICRSQACAAIKALREPTKEMVNAGAIEVAKYDGFIFEGEDVSPLTWQTMIDEALK